MHNSKTSYRYLMALPIGVATVLCLGAAPAVVRSISAGFGLIGGGTGNVTLSVDTAAIQRRVSDVCGAGEAIQAIATSGAVTCAPTGPPLTAFVHRATAATIPEVEPGVSIIDNPLTNGDPDAILLVTPRVSDPGGTNVVDPHPIAVTYITTATCPGCDPVLLNKWLITHADSTVITPGAEYNVVVVKP
jgi:hypothetical protein